MAKDDNDLIKYAGLLAVGYFGVIRPVLNSIGVNPEDANTIDSIAKSDDASNPFSPNFGIAYSLETGENVDFAQQSFDFIKKGWNDPANLGTDGIHSTLPYISLAEEINDAVGFWDIDADRVISLFNQVRYQYEVSQMVQYLSYRYGTDLLSLLRFGRPIISLIRFGVGTDVLAQIINHIRTLPMWSTDNPMIL